MNPDRAPSSETPVADRYLSVPNLLCLGRLLASPFLIVLAALDLPHACLGLCAVLMATDWVDGKIAKYLKQASKIGPWLDSIADAVLFTCVLTAVVILRFDLIAREAIWIAASVVAYSLSLGLGVLRFRKYPSYHTYLAKFAWWLTALAVAAILLDWSPWLLRIAAAAVALANFEAIAITLTLTEPRANVRSIWHVWNESRSTSKAELK